ncbi:MAG TPA: hypothetical protein ENN69_04685 [Spirochaetia bacterium]|nr:hypothetical protein [Spirochaetia bacterium]
MKKRFACLLAALLSLTLLSAQENTDKIRRHVILTPVTELTENAEFAYLSGTIYNVLLVNFRKQESLFILNGQAEGTDEPSGTGDFEGDAAKLRRLHPGAAAVRAEYYVAGGTLNIIINVWDLDSLRVKRTFTESMPADLDMLRNLERMAAGTAEAVAHDLPPTEREALFQKQIAARLRHRINEEEKLVEEIFSLRHELSIVPFSGIGLGRTVVSWSMLGPFISPVLNLEYSALIGDSYHLRVSCEYLGFDLTDPDPERTEFALDVMVGMHSRSLFSLSFDAGIAVIYDHNPESAALAYTLGLGEYAPSAERFSLSLPLQLGLTIYPSPHTFLAFRLKYHGLTWTIESLPPSAYDVGHEKLTYTSGFSLWNLLCMTFQIRAGVRF